MISKRKTAAIIVTLFLFITKAFATGAGVQVGLRPGILLNENGKDASYFSGTVTGTLRFSRIPLVVGGGFEAGKDGYGLMAFADYWYVDVQLKNTCNFYSGFGLSVDLISKNFKNFTYSAGTRFFVGLNWLFYDSAMEFFTQMNLVPTVKSNKDFILAIPFETGIRMHF